MKCVIYKGHKKPDTYLYIEREDDFERVPEQLLSMMGTLTRVMDLELSRGRTLAQADVGDVVAALVERGFYLQLPPEDKPEH
jgi:uncharacterized protein YcgL (UPF0745 family)